MALWQLILLNHYFQEIYLCVLLYVHNVEHIEYVQKEFRAEGSPFHPSTPLLVC